MKLSTLIHYRNLLRKYTPVDTETLVREHIGHAQHLVQTHEIQFPSLTKQLDDKYQNILSSFVEYKDTIGSVQQEIQKLIDSIEPEYFAKSYQLYEQFFSRDRADYVLDRRLEITDETRSYLHGRIRAYGDWHHPGLIIRPGQEEWIEDLVACDPLYLVDRDIDFLEPTLSRFNEDYRRRLRPYLMKDNADDQICQQLPDNQIGFCLAYYYFNFKPFEIVKANLEEIFQKLKPGGTMAFTFNNCDRSGAVELVERNYMCFTPGKLLLALCESIGFEIKQTYQLDAACTWVEMSKPGRLASLRGGQSLARIVAKSK